MPWYDYGCRNCDYWFEEQSRIDDRKKPCDDPCPECGGEVRILLNAPALVDPVIINRTKPNDGYKEVIAKINETNGLKGSRYELEPQLEQREKNKQKALTEWEVKERVNDNLKAKKGRIRKTRK